MIFITLISEIQAYCPECRKTYWIEFSYDLYQNKKEENGMRIGLPSVPQINEKADSGLIKRSLSHGDHILMIEIDKLGSVRKANVVYLISSIVERIIASAVEKTFSVNLNFPLRYTNILLISNSPAFRKFFKSYLSVISLNTRDDKNLRAEICKLTIDIFYDRIRVTQTSEDGYSIFLKEKNLSSLVIDTESIANLDLILKNLPKEKRERINLILAYNSKKIKNEDPKTVLSQVFENGILKVSFLDYSTGKGLGQVIENGILNLAE